MNEPAFPFDVGDGVAEADGSTSKAASRRAPRHRLAEHNFCWLLIIHADLGC